MAQNSVGLVQACHVHLSQALALKCGKTLNGFDLAYETYGQLNAQKSNAVLICHALSGSHHAAGKYQPDDKYAGWWDNAIGPGKAIDTNKFFVICANNIGGCNGSTGPNSINPQTGTTYGSDFPLITVADWVYSQKLLLDFLEIDTLAAVVGGSMGGMQALQWSIDFADKVRHVVAIACAPNLTAQNIAFNEVARQAIMRDPDFNNGHYQAASSCPATGLMLARMLGHITYLSNDGMGEKFGRKLQRDQLYYDFDTEYQVESYLRYQGNKFVGTFDANSYLLMTKALDYFDPAQDFDNHLAAAFANSIADFLVVSFTTDWRFPPKRSREIVYALTEAQKNVSYAQISSSSGHDAFLMPIPEYMQVLSAYMQQITV